MLAGKQAAKHLAALVHGTAEDGAVRPRKISVLKNTDLVGLVGREVNGFESRARDAHHLARLDFADVMRVEQIEGAGFAGDDPRVSAVWSGEFAGIEGTEA